MNDFAPPAAFRRPPLPRWPLTVVDAFDVTPRMRRVRLVGERTPLRPGIRFTHVRCCLGREVK